MPAGKRESEGDGDGEAKRQRPSAAPTGRFDGGSRRVDLLNPATPRSDGDPPAEDAPPAAASVAVSVAVTERAPHPMDALNAIRAQLATTTDPHLQAKLLLRFSEAAISPGALTDAAIDFLFAFLQENQKASAGESKTQDQAKGGGDAGSSGAIVVGAIVRGLRSLLAVKAAVVEPMIQVDAMGEQLMQCLSVGEDFKLRREMMRIVVDCLVLSRRFAQVARLLATCVRDHDAGMQAICLRGYLRLHDADHGAVITREDGDSSMVAVGKMGGHFDCLATFLLHGGDEDVRVLAARAIAALVGETHAQRLEVRSAFFPPAAISASRRPLVLQDMAFYVLCMAASDAAASVRVECALSLRGLIGARSCVDRAIIEHAVQKMPVDDMGAGDTAGDDEMRTVRMMSSGALLSLLEDASARVAEEASRTMARMGRASFAQAASSTARSPSETWSERALRRAVTAHFDVLARLEDSDGTMSLHQVLVSSLMQLVTCLHEQLPNCDIVLSTEQMNCLLWLPSLPFSGSAKWLFTVLSVLACCNLSSVTAVQRTLDVALEAADKLDGLRASLGAKRPDTTLPDELIDVLSTVGEKCAPVLRVNPSLLGRLGGTVGAGSCTQTICRALRMGNAYTRGSDPTSMPPTTSTSAFERLIGAKSESNPAVDAGVGEAAALIAQPLDMSDNAAIASYLKAIQRLRSRYEAESALPSCYLAAEALVRLKDCLRSRSTTCPVIPPVTNTPARLPPQAVRHCYVLIDISRSALAKQYALSAGCRSDLLQLLLLARIGLDVDQSSSQAGADRLAAIEHLSHQASSIQKLLSSSSPSSPTASGWFNFDALRKSSSAEEIAREFVRVASSAWPRAWLSQAAHAERAGYMSALSAEATASICFDGGRCEPPKEPLEVTANWPFTHRVQAVVESVRDISQVFIKSVLPDGETAFHKVPLASLVHPQSSRRFSLDHSISLVVSPFSDPTAFYLAICVRHDRVPGADNEEGDGAAFTEISPRVSIPIFHRSTSALRPVPLTAKAKA